MLEPSHYLKNPIYGTYYSKMTVEVAGQELDEDERFMIFKTIDSFLTKKK